MTIPNLRQRYENDGTGVVPQNRLLLMLVDRMVVDVENALVALETDQHGVVNAKLCNAQSILLELHAALDLETWPDGVGLARLYLWHVNELMDANVKKDAKKLKTSLPMLRDIRDAWHGAFQQTISAPPAAPATASAAVVAPAAR